jgi:chaperone required for assembly of F1-ATPase
MAGACLLTDGQTWSSWLRKRILLPMEAMAHMLLSEILT